MSNFDSSETGSQTSQEYLYPRSQYRGKFTPENLVFNANLQEFAQKIGYVCALETGGKISSAAAYEQIKQLWKLLDVSKHELGITDDKPPSDS